MRSSREIDFGLVRTIALLAITAIGLYLCYLLILPFIAALTWAVAAAVLAAPMHQAIARRLRRPNLAAAISVVLVILVIVLPVAAVGQRLAGTFQTGLETVQGQLANGNLQQSVEQHPWLSSWLAWADTVFDRQDVMSVFNNVGAWLTNLATTAVRASVSNVVTLVITFYLLFYFLRDRRPALRQVRLVSPFSDAETSYLSSRAAETIRGVFYGTIVTSTIQGALGGMIFWLVGLPDPVFWGVVMALLSIVPLLGAFVVWLPAAAYLALAGEWISAGVVVAYGSVVISGIDNVLYPVLAGGRLRLHTVPVFISIVGGLLVFGAAGLVLGPLVASMTVAMLEIWRSRAVARPFSTEKRHDDRQEQMRHT